jgi:hypothetical protein
VAAVFIGAGAVFNVVGNDDRDALKNVGLVAQLLGLALIVVGILLELRRRRR